MQYTNSTAAPRQELTDVVMEGVTNQKQFVGLRTAPAFPLDLPTGHVPKIKISTGNLMRASAKVRTPGADFDRWQSGIDALSLTLLQVAEEVSIPDEQSMVYDKYFDFEGVYAKEASNRLLRSHELDVEATVFNTGNFDATNSTVAYTAALLATMDPVGDIIAAIQLVAGRGETANTVVIPYNVWNRIRQSTLMKSFIAGSINPGAQVTPNALAAALSDLGITQVLIGSAFVNQSQDSLSNSINPIWPNTYIFVGAVAEGSLQSGGWGRTFYWNALGAIFGISSYRDETKMSNVIRAMKQTLVGVTNANAGTLITTQYS